MPRAACPQEARGRTGSVETIYQCQKEMLPPRCTRVVAPRPLWQGSTITVNTTTDELNSDGDCALREAVRAANPRIEVDGFWSAVARGEDVTKEAAATPRGRF